MRIRKTALLSLVLESMLVLPACDDDDDDKDDVTKKPTEEQSGDNTEDSNTPSTPDTPSTPAEPGSVLTAQDILKQMYAGINIGNTLECASDKNAAGVVRTDGGYNPWSGTKVNQTYIKGLKALGFNAVRIPCSWNEHLSKMDPKTLTWTIDAKWLATVDEVVKWITDEGMYAILNSHWDTGWLEDNIGKGYTKAIDARQKTFWTQIATYFNKYDQHLLFAGMNEPYMNETSNGGSCPDAGIQTIMRYQQTFVDAVRATGGNNAKRILVSQTPATRLSDGLKDVFQMPTDKVNDVEQTGYQICEFHCYDPYNFCLMPKDEPWGTVFLYWGSVNHVSGSKRNASWGEESEVKTNFAKMKVKFVDKGIPCIIGECSTQFKPESVNLQTGDNVPYDEAKHKASRAYWNEVIFREAKNNGICPFYWETGDEINRTDGTWKEAYKYSLEGIMKGAKEGNYPF